MVALRTPELVWADANEDFLRAVNPAARSILGIRAYPAVSAPPRVPDGAVLRVHRRIDRRDPGI
jgi:hypothetical protein